MRRVKAPLHKKSKSTSLQLYISLFPQFCTDCLIEGELLTRNETLKATTILTKVNEKSEIHSLEAWEILSPWLKTTALKKKKNEENYDSFQFQYSSDSTSPLEGEVHETRSPIWTNSYVNDSSVQQ